MLQAPVLEYDSDASTVVSYEETPEERRQRKLKKKQAQRREKDKKIQRKQHERRKKREADLLYFLAKQKEKEERERRERWGAVDEEEAETRAAPPREQDRPTQPAETKHPGLWSNYPRKLLGETELSNAAHKSPVTFGYRAPYEFLDAKYTLPRRKKLRDPELLEKNCVVCAWNVAGCPACWRPVGAIRTFNKVGSSKKYAREGDKDESHGAAGTFSSKAIPHTKMRDMEAIAYHRRTMCFVNIFVKTLPSGEIVKLRLETNDTVGYLFHQFRNHAPMVGYDDRMYFVFPTEAGLVVASPEVWYGTEANRGYNYASYKLSEYKINVPESSAAFFHVSRINDATTPRLVQAFYRSNFTMTRPWLTRILNHLSFLPDTMPGDDDAQGVVARWCVESKLEMEKWIQYDKDLEAEQRAAGDYKEEAVRKEGQLAEVKVRNQRWKRARRRDARLQLAEAAEMMRLAEEERKAQEAARLAEEAKAKRKAEALAAARREQDLRRAGPRARRQQLAGK